MAPEGEGIKSFSTLRTLSGLKSSAPLPLTRCRHVAAGFEPAQTFPFFPKLPVELQRQIWVHALPGPRVIEIHKKGKTIVKGLTQQEYGSALFDPVALLHTCRQSREIVLKCYKLALSNRLTLSVYFDATTDIVLMADVNALEYILQKRIGSQLGDEVRYIAIDPTSPLNTNTGIFGSSRRTTHDITNNGISYLAQAIERYRSLEEVIILYPTREDNEIPSWFENSVIELLEKAVERIGFDPNDMPSITCWPYQASDREAGRRRAIREWSNIDCSKY